MSEKPSFSPPYILRNSHIQSILNSVGPRKIRAKRLMAKLNSQMLILETAEGVRLAAEFDRASISESSKNALVILLHGWEGSSKSAYSVTTANTLLEAGYDVLRLNLRDHGDTQHLNRDIFNSTMTDEVADSMALFLADHDYPDVFLAGFSLGASFTLRIATDRGQELGLTAAVAICPPVDPTSAMDTMGKTLVIYEKYFFHRWTTSLRKKLKFFPEHDFAAELSMAKTLDDLNKTFIPKFTPYEDAQSYFESYPLIGDRLKNLSIPAHLIATSDDPIIPAADLTKINCPEHLSIEVQKYGGHCGFIQSAAGHSWIETRLVQLFEQHLTESN